MVLETVKALKIKMKILSKMLALIFVLFFSLQHDISWIIYQANLVHF